ncbi:MarR family winged helix-turn-helix transcriptional regulator [[Clostridium] fimetarium]|uniref:DNA-binding transcriptional regulator, MarR family n=1 Tax=[Clostridium] fimetarium TaxID=99656 RepID=A0A1I0Q9E4_9FIRM|nr:MarR family winged helix-turn-helix transcriptional regulator [[Clostridium] fimetarium]SEW23413.1 DNA-binding transcriptional regulator, MarR family [[Clostridium] fimetarium]
MQPDGIMHLLKLNNKIFRYTQIYLDKVLKEFQLSSGSYPYLLILKDKDGINQNRISEELGYDKAMTTRTLAKLIKIGYLDRIRDDDDFRANKIFLTEKGKAVTVKILDKLHELEKLITTDLNEEEKVNTIESLNKILCNIKKVKII